MFSNLENRHLWGLKKRCWNVFFFARNVFFSIANILLIYPWKVQGTQEEWSSRIHPWYQCWVSEKKRKIHRNLGVTIIFLGSLMLLVSMLRFKTFSMRLRSSLEKVSWKICLASSMMIFFLHLRTKISLNIMLRRYF